jgi:type III pantothenate kinase
VLLAIDIRNGSIKAGFRSDGQWRGVVNFGAERTADEYAFLLEAAFSRIAASDRLPVTQVWLSSVVPTLTPRVVRGAVLAFGQEATLVGPGIKTGIKIRTDVPTEVGSDIVCAAAAAHALAKGPVLVVEFASAIAISAVTAQAELLGVAIAPGLEMSRAAMRAGSAQLPDVRMDLPRRAIGRTTAQAIQSGLFYGFGGLVQRLITMMSAEMSAGMPASNPTGLTTGLSADPVIIGCGDDEGRQLLESIGHHSFQPNLVLDGLAVIAARN